VVDELRDALLGWFAGAKRDLPWRRRSRDAYAVWVSEIMLQQTRVETVIPYFERWMRRFSTVKALAEAPLDDVLAHWAGLGYYARARNLHRAAQLIVERFGGTFPHRREDVHALPGIGRYTAGAILSIAFGQKEPILDGNVARVIARVWKVPGAVDEKAFKERAWNRAGELAQCDAPGDLNQALMELGATVCTPRAPQCGKCPIDGLCGARSDGEDSPERWPAPKTRAAVKEVEQVTVLLEREGKLLLARRPAAGLWGGLWEPPTRELERGERPERAAERVARDCAGLDLTMVEPLDRFEHVLTHRRMRFSAFRGRGRGRARAGGGYEAVRWMPVADALELGVSAWTKRLLRSV
jgi:A/G-specific adenine glycosylase